MLPEITNALHLMGVIILLLVVAVAVLGVVAFRLYQHVRALYEHLQSLEGRVTGLSRRVSHRVRTANTENRGGSRDA